MDQGIGATLTTFATQMLGLSIAAERVTEVIKQWLISRTASPTPPPAPADPTATPTPAVSNALPAAQTTARHTATYQSIAFPSGMFVVTLAHVDPLSIVTNWAATAKIWPHLPRVLSIVATGLLVSGGSAVWNNLLDLLTAAKVNREQANDGVFINNSQPAASG